MIRDISFLILLKLIDVYIIFTINRIMNYREDNMSKIIYVLYHLLSVGWGGACFNVFVNLHMKLRCGCRLGHVFMGGGWGVGWDNNVTGSLTHTSCYATVRSLGLPHTHIMLRYCTFSWTSTHTSCYATVRSLERPHIHHATLLYYKVLE